MTVTINARGTSHSRFQIGKTGPSIDAQGVVKAASGGSVEIQTDYGAAMTVGSDGRIDLSTPALNINGKLWPEISGTATQVLIANTQGEMEWDTLTEYAAPASHVGSGGSQHSIATSTTAGFMSPSDKVRLDGLTTDVSGVPLLNPLLIYYGYPIAYKGLLDVSAVVADITTNYKYWVVGHSYQDPLHEKYASTVSIIQAVRAAGVVVYGYIPLGTTSYNYTISQIGDIADQWTAIGIDGIFLDEYGFDYGNSRQRQIDAVTLIHAKSLQVCANAWVAEEFMCDTLTETGWNTDDWRYVRWVEKNPTDLASPIALGDSYLIENFCYDHLGPVSIWDAQERVAHIRQLATDKGASLWAVAVFGETTPGYVDIGKLGSLGTLQQCGEYISANAYLYDIDIVGSGGFSFGSNGTPVSAPIYRMPTKANVPELPATNNYTTKTAVRFFGSVRLEITNTDTIQSVSINGAIEPVIGDKSSEYATKTDIADHEAAADPHPQYATAAEAAAAAPVQSVAGKTGAVTIGKADVGLSNVDNTSDAEKPISTATQAALDGKATPADIADAISALPEGPAGADGASAYEVAVQNGFVGTEAQWLASLVGPAGADGSPGAAGADGASAYEVAVAAGFVGTEAQWLESLVGPAGPQGEPGSGGAGGPTLQGDTAPYVTQTKTYTITNYSSFSSYAVAVSAGAASISGDTITFTSPATAGNVNLTVTVDGAPSVFAISVQAPVYIPTPTPTPAAFGDPLEGGFYAGMVWQQLTQSSTSKTIATGVHTFAVPDMTGAPIVYLGQTVEMRSRANPANKFIGTVEMAKGSSLTLNVTSVGGSGTFSDWSVMACHRIIVAPKASGEHAGIALKHVNTALPTSCQTLTEGWAATMAMFAADTSTVYPAAHWARSLNINGRTDWYIPARDELELCWRNLKPTTVNNYTPANRQASASFNYAQNGSYGDTASTHGRNNNSAPTGAAYTATVPGQTAATAFRTGGAEALGYPSSYYLTCSDHSATTAWNQHWNSSSSGGQGNSNKTSTFCVRAVRRSVI